MRYQQFASHAYCGAMGSVSKMASQQEKALCVLGFEVSSSVITVERKFHAWFRKDAPHRNNITRWYWQFVETGCLCKGKRPRVPDDNTEFDYRVDVWRVTQGAHTEGLWLTHETVAAADGVRCAHVRWEINFLLTSETTPFFCVYPV